MAASCIDWEGIHPRPSGGGLMPSDFNDYICPVGMIVGWAKNLGGVTPSLPSNWKECDGSVISDANSPLNGQTLPDLSDERFLRGADTSGGSGDGGGSASHSHIKSSSGASRDVTDHINIQCGQYARSIPVALGGGSASVSIDVVPPYYDVVFVMRIK